MTFQTDLHFCDFVCLEQKHVVCCKIYEKISSIAQEKFSVENMAYTQMFIDCLHTKDPFKLKFFDECSLKLPFHGQRLYGDTPLVLPRFI